MSANRKPLCLYTKNKLFAESAKRINDVLCAQHSRRHYSYGLGLGYHAGISISLMTWSLIGKTTDNDSGGMYTFVDLDQYFFEMADLLQ
jgi:hypothetical protein